MADAQDVEMIKAGTEAETVNDSTKPEADQWIDVGDGDGGILKKIIEEGKGSALPPKGAEVKVHYTGRLEDGSVFDSSKERDQPFKFKLGKGQVIKGWDKGIATMRQGERAFLKIRPEYAYGDQAQAKIPAGSTLIFEVDMLSWKTGENVTSDGGVIKLQTLHDGEGYKKPKDPLWVRVKYSLKALSPEGQSDLIEENDDLKFTLGEDSVFSGLEKATESLVLHEVALFSLAGQYLPSSLSPAEDVQYHLQVELLEIEQEKPSWEMTVTEKIHTANLRKDQATEFFRQGKFDLAVKRYSKAADFVNYKHDFSDEEKNEASAIETAIRLNKAAAFLKLKKWSDVVSECDKILKESPSHPKALYRKALALEENLDWDEAERLLVKVTEITPEDATIKRELARLRKKVSDYERSQAQKYRKLFA